jgi:phenylalanyl-tRNA synthetase beta subunit
MSDVISCASCDRPISDARPRQVDERTDATFCDRRCFDDWAAANAADIAAYYYELNVYTED